MCVVEHTVSLNSDGGDGALLNGRSRSRGSGGRKNSGNGEGLHDDRVWVDDNYGWRLSDCCERLL